MKPEPIAYVAVHMDNERIAISSSYNAFGGYDTVLAENCFGQRCVSTTHKKPRTWRTMAGAQKFCDEQNDYVRTTRGTGYKKVMPRAIYATTSELRDYIYDATRDHEKLIAAWVAVNNPKEVKP